MTSRIYLIENLLQTTRIFYKSKIGHLLDAPKYQLILYLRRLSIT